LQKLYGCQVGLPNCWSCSNIYATCLVEGETNFTQRNLVCICMKY
jgi:hypothetical protein